MADILQKAFAAKFEDHLSSGDPRTMKWTISSELMDGLDALAKERQGKITLKKRVLNGSSACSTSSLPDIPLSRAGSLLQVVCRSLILWPPRITVGAWLAREGVRSVDIIIA